MPVWGVGVPKDHYALVTETRAECCPLHRTTVGNRVLPRAAAICTMSLLGVVSTAAAESALLLMPLCALNHPIARFSISHCR